MAHIHISLVGAQAYPVYLAIADLAPDAVLLVHSNSTQKEATLVEAEINVPTRMLLLDPVDISQIFATVKGLYESINYEDTYSINLSGGTKLWSLAFYEYFRNLNHVRLLYIDQNNLIYDLHTQTAHRSQVVVDMDQTFRLNGVDETLYDRIADYTYEDCEVSNRLFQMRGSYNFGLRSLSVLDKFKMKEVEDNETGSLKIASNILKWDKINNTIEVKLMNGDKKTSQKFTSPHIFRLFFYTGWFELRVAKLLSQWKYAKEIRLSVKFPYLQDGNPKNEIDIIVNTGNRLLFVECKTQISSITDIDKFRTAVKNYGGMSSKALFVTLDPMKGTAAEKCADSGILAFSISDACKESSYRAELFSMLESELFEINKK